MHSQHERKKTLSSKAQFVAAAKTRAVVVFRSHAVQQEGIRGKTCPNRVSF